MNEGIIAARYAKALLRYEQEALTGEETYSQAEALVFRMSQVEKLDSYICRHPEITLEQKTSLIEAALEQPLSCGLKKFVRLVYRRRRMQYFRRMLLSFIDQYRVLKSIKVGRLVVCSHVPGLRERLEQMISARTGASVQLVEEENPDLLGGFIIELDGLKLDASVREQLRRLRRELIDNNNRIV